jgi:hypothetical protein
MVVIGVSGLAYAFVIFFVFMIGQAGTPALRNGQYCLQDHGH